MARYTDILRDDCGLPIVGALITVTTDDGAKATLTADGGGAMANPFKTGVLGEVTFNATDNIYTLEYRYGGRVVRKDRVLVGSPPQFRGATGIAGPSGPGFQPSAFGPINGVDDTATMLILAGIVNASPNGMYIQQPPSKIAITSDIVFTKSITWVGAGASLSQIICKNGARVLCSYGNMLDYDTPMGVFEKVIFKALGNHPSAPFRMQFSGVGSTAVSCILRDVEVSGVGPTDSFKYGVDFSNCSSVEIDNIRIIGNHGDGPLRTVASINYESTNRSSQFSIDTANIYYAQKAIRGSSNMEGVTIRNLLTAVVLDGIDWACTDEGHAAFNLIDSFINAERCGVRLFRVFQYTIDNLLVYPQSSDGTFGAGAWIGIDVTGAPIGVSTLSTINNAKIYMFDPTIPTTRTGIYLRGNGGRADTIITNSHAFAGERAIVMDAQTFGVIVAPTNNFINQTIEPVLNLGSNNIVSFSDALGRYSIGHSDPPVAKWHVGEKNDTGRAGIAAENLSPTNTLAKTVSFDMWGRAISAARTQVGSFIARPVDANWSASEVSLQRCQGGVMVDTAIFGFNAPTPEGVRTALVGTVLYTTAGKTFQKKTGTGNTGWVENT